MGDFPNSAFSSYLRQIERCPTLDRTDELELARAAHAGDQRARDRLIRGHLRDVVAIARRYRGYGLPMADLVAVGSLGLIRGVDRFDPERGLRLMTYASYWVRAEILAHIVASWSVVELGTSSLQTRLFFGLHRQRTRLQARHGEQGVSDAGEDLIEALAKHFDCRPAQINAVLQRIDGRDLSLERPAEGAQGSGASLGERLPSGDCPEASAIARERQRLVRRRVESVMERLDERERLICRSRILADSEGEDTPSLASLGVELELSRERVRQLEQRVRKTLRRSMIELHA